MDKSLGEPFGEVIGGKNMANASTSLCTPVLKKAIDVTFAVVDKDIKLLCVPVLGILTEPEDGITILFGGLVYRTPW